MVKLSYTIRASICPDMNYPYIALLYHQFPACTILLFRKKHMQLPYLPLFPILLLRGSMIEFRIRQSFSIRTAKSSPPESRKEDPLKKIMTAVFILISAFLLISCGGPKRSSEEIIQDIAVSYGAYGEAADEKVDELLKELKRSDADLSEKWSRIMELWRSLDSGLTVHEDILPDGLPKTDELCLVALGFQLNPDGSIKEELKERLEVVKKSAEKYPDSRILCTGGPTSPGHKDVTEAGKMAEWLIQNGIDQKRILIEDRSVTTAQNAIYSYDLLSEGYPQVKELAIISSDYHIATGTLLFEAEAILRAEKEGKEKISVTSNAAWQAPSGSLSSMFQAGALIELSGDRETAFEIYRGTYDMNALPDIS